MTMAVIVRPADTASFPNPARVEPSSSQEMGTSTIFNPYGVIFGHMDLLENTRRKFLRLAGSITVVGVAGCTGADGGSGEEGAEELPEGVSEEEFERGPVPEAYRTATSQAGEKRDPDALVSKEDVQFQEAPDAVEAGLAEEGQSCENCAEFIPDENGDGFGACAKVEGYIGPEDWCALWESIEEAQDEY